MRFTFEDTTARRSKVVIYNACAKDITQAHSEMRLCISC